MELRNKKTGKVTKLDVHCIAGKNYESLAEINEEWEDLVKEPKKYWFINPCGEVVSFYEEDENPADTKASKAIGDYFDTREEAEKAVEKLKAWKRLKDKGVNIIDYGCYGGTNTKGEFLGEVRVTIDVPQEVDKYLFKLFFGGEE